MALLAVLFLVAARAAAQVAVPATANIYGAGHAIAPAPGGSGGGVLPVLIPIPPGTATVWFTSVTGSVDFGGCCAPNGPDGVAGAGTAPGNDWDGLAGIDGIPRGRFLGAVFLDDTEPADPPPAGLPIPDIGFATLAPALRQTFFVGDGRTGTASGVLQEFVVPPGATRLFLGLHDAGPPDPSLPGWYGDNSGSLSVTVELAPPVVPLLGPLGALALLVGGLGVLWRAR